MQYFVVCKTHISQHTRTRCSTVRIFFDYFSKCIEPALKICLPFGKTIFIPLIVKSLFSKETLSKPQHCYYIDLQFSNIKALFRALVFLCTQHALFLCSRCSAMHATNVERNSWRLPPDDTVQVADQRSKSAEVSLISPCTCSSNSDTAKTGLQTQQPVSGHDPTVPPVPYSYNSPLDPSFPQP